MIEDVLNFATSCMYLIMPGTLIIMLLYKIFEWYKMNDSYNIGKRLKMTLCTASSVFIMVVVMIEMIIQTFQVSSIWKENNLDSFSETCALFGIVGTWQVIGAVLIFLVWRFIYMNQIISGDGPVSQRIKNIFSRNFVPIILCIVTVCIAVVIAVFAFFNVPIGIPMK